MARLTQQQLDWYRKAVSDEGLKATNYVNDAIKNTQSYKDYVFNNGDQKYVAQLRDDATKIIKEAVKIYGDNAQVISDELFDYIMNLNRDNKWWGLPNEFYDDLINDEDISRMVHYDATKLTQFREETTAKQMAEKYANKVASNAGYLTKRSAWENTKRRCKYNGIRYAVVPTGLETCAFCFMLASRGFVYTKYAKKKGVHSGDIVGYHKNCDCVMIPEGSTKLDIDGYDPDALQEKYIEARHNADSGSPTDIVKAIDNLAKDKGWDYMYGKSTS